MVSRLIYFHRIHFPSASGQTIQVIRDYGSMSSRYDVHLMYRAPSVIAPSHLNSLLTDYHSSLSSSFHMHCIQEGFRGRQYFYRVVKSLVAGSKKEPIILVVRTMDHAKKALAIRDTCRLGKLIKVVLELHETAIPHMVYLEAGRSLRAFVSRRLENKIFSKVDGIVCTVGSQLQVLDEKFPDHAPAVILPNNVPAQMPVVRNNASNELERENSNCFRMRYAGQFTAWKNTDIMFEALSKLPENFVLELAGGKMNAMSETKELIDEMSKKFGVLGRVAYFGFLPPVEVASFLRQADCLLLPLGNEVQARLFTSPMKLFEYAASGKPMIVTQQPTTNSLVNDDEHVLMVRPGVAEDISIAAERLAGDVHLGERIASNASRWVEKYSAENRAAEYHLFLEKIIGQ